MTTISEFAPAKVNLSLEIRGRRLDGYHELASLVAFATTGDTVHATPAEALSLEITGPEASALTQDLPDPQSNILLKAISLAADLIQTPVHARFELEKALPVAAGIGGGSADAAAALRLTQKLLDHPVSADDLARAALTLGADVPVCLQSRTVWMTGIGEVLSPPVRMPPLPAVLVNPRQPVPTGLVFKALNAGPVDEERLITCPADFGTLSNLCDWLEEHPNHLQAPAEQIAPVVTQVLNALDTSGEPEMVRMSGSGATCFGLYASESAAREACEKITHQHADWWVAETRLGG